MTRSKGCRGELLADNNLTLSLPDVYSAVIIRNSYDFNFMNST